MGEVFKCEGPHRRSPESIGLHDCLQASPDKETYRERYCISEHREQQNRKRYNKGLQREFWLILRFYCLFLSPHNQVPAYIYDLLSPITAWALRRADGALLFVPKSGLATKIDQPLRCGAPYPKVFDRQRQLSLIWFAVFVLIIISFLSSFESGSYLFINLLLPLFNFST